MDFNSAARSILFLIPPNSKPPFQVRLGLDINEPSVRATGDFLITDCMDISSAIQKGMKIVANLKLTMATDFTLVFPMFVGKNEAEEAEIINNAWLIKEAADANNWQFSRILPTPIF